ncbi:MAG: flagellar hook-length control protein FliK [Tepidimonas fonticaldi]|nr:flagellar hook-length control protein FliK [Tepidimonas fonticaldi]
MKAESLPPASSTHGAHRPQGPQGQRSHAPDPQGGDPFAQLLADLCADDATGLRDAEASVETDTDAATKDDPRDPSAKEGALPDTAVALTAAATPAAAPQPPASNAAGPTDARTEAAAEGLKRRPWALAEEAANPTPGDTTANTPAPSTPPMASASAHPVADLAKGGGLGQLMQATASDAPWGNWVSTVARSKQRSPGAALANGRPAQREASAPDAAAGPLALATRVDRHPSDATAMMAPPAPPPAALMERAETSTHPGERREAERAPDALRPAGLSTADTPTTTAAGSPGPDASDFGLQLGQALGEAFESLGAQVSLWTAGKSQRASFSLQEGTDDPLEVDLTVTDGVAQVLFRTDDGAMRQLIQAQAPAVLAEALARVGLTLGGVDVGGQFAHGQGQPPADASPRTVRMGLTPVPTAEPARAGQGVLLRGTSGRAGLDVYA